MFFQLLHLDFDCFFQLCVVSLTPCRGIEIDFYIWRDAMVLDLPIAVQAAAAPQIQAPTLPILSGEFPDVMRSMGDVRVLSAFSYCTVSFRRIV